MLYHRPRQYDFAGENIRKIEATFIFQNFANMLLLYGEGEGKEEAILFIEAQYG